MSLILAKIMTYMPVMVAFAATKNGFVDKIVGWAAGVGGGIIAIFIIVSLVKDGIEFAKGQGSSSVFKIIGKVLFLLVILGLIYLAMNYDTLGTTACNLGNNAVNTINNEVNNTLFNNTQ